MFRASYIVGLIILIPCLAMAQERGGNVSAEEYAVMAAMLDGFHEAGRASHPIVADYTSTFDCGSICNGMKVGRCNGLAMDSETPEQRLSIVARDLPDLDQATIRDFKAKNSRCAKVTENLPSRFQSFLFGNEHREKLPSGWEHADFFYFSRVGFNANLTQALVNVSFMSGTDASSSGGKYFFLKKENGKWVPLESSIVWQLTSR